MSERTRAWIYGVLTAVNPLLISYGILDEQVAPLWIGLVGAVLGTGLAKLNTSAKRVVSKPQEESEGLDDA